ncbi:MAG: TetR/AcrR family transcriptional regulator [Deltaproteobacteria bacterium]|nr:TetR/AcrR family transcriptional regulator [Deltaproteobacteria bacterium]
MTKHRSKQEWIFEILEAARAEIDENGYADFSMEAVVRRTGFSKGGIYRFFGNKSDIALRIFAESYEAILSFDVQACLEWQLPMADTVFRLFNRYRLPEEGARRQDRIWIRLLPEVLNDQRFSLKRAELLAEIEMKIGTLCIELAKRDGFSIPVEFKEKFADSFELSAAMMEGLAVQTALGSAIEHQGALVKAFIDNLLHDMFYPEPREK